MRALSTAALRGYCALGLLMLGWPLPATARPRPAAADLVLVGGHVLASTATGEAPHALAVRAGRVAYVGDSDGARRYVGARTRIVDLHGGLVLPGFVDAHVHPATVPDPAVTLDLAGLYSLAALEARVRAFAQSHPDKPWLDGTGWDKLAFAPGERPDRALLDAWVGDRPALLYDNSGHEAWANSAALRAAGITRLTADPPSGRIDRDSGGEPTGLLHEDAAMNLVQSRIPPLSDAEQRTALEAALAQMTALGITAFEDAMATEPIARAYASLAREGRLAQRVNLCLPFDPDQGDDEQIARFVRARRQLRVGPLSADCVKLFLDGAAAHTMAMLEPYSDEPARYGRGALFIDRQRLDRLVVRLDALGFRVHMHAQGDWAVRAGLDALELARRRNGGHDRRHTIAHLWLVDPADVARFRALGVVANLTPVWSRGDTWELADAPRLFGARRNLHTFPTRSLLDAGATLVFGTDWPVTELSPLDGLETAVTHRYAGGHDPLGHEDAVWHPWERIGLDEAIAAYTRTGAWFLHEERRRGRLRRGYVADLVVLDRDPRAGPAEAIHDARVRLTLIGGRIRFERADTRVPSAP